MRGSDFSEVVCLTCDGPILILHIPVSEEFTTVRCVCPFLGSRTMQGLAVMVGVTGLAVLAVGELTYWQAIIRRGLVLVSVLLSVAAETQQTERVHTGAATASPATNSDQGASSKFVWQYKGFVDLGYLLDFNHPSNHLFRNRGTAPRVDEVDLNHGEHLHKVKMSIRIKVGHGIGGTGGRGLKEVQVLGDSAGPRRPEFPASSRTSGCLLSRADWEGAHGTGRNLQQSNWL